MVVDFCGIRIEHDELKIPRDSIKRGKVRETRRCYHHTERYSRQRIRDLGGSIAIWSAKKKKKNVLKSELNRMDPPTTSIRNIASDSHPSLEINYYIFYYTRIRGNHTLQCNCNNCYFQISISYKKKKTAPTLPSSQFILCTSVQYLFTHNTRVYKFITHRAYINLSFFYSYILSNAIIRRWRASKNDSKLFRSLHIFCFLFFAHTRRLIYCKYNKCRSFHKLSLSLSLCLTQHTPT